MFNNETSRLYREKIVIFGRAKDEPMPCDLSDTDYWTTPSCLVQDESYVGRLFVFDPHPNCDYIQNILISRPSNCYMRSAPARYVLRNSAIPCDGFDHIEHSIVAEFGPHFACSISMMIGFAILLKPKEIILWRLHTTVFDEIMWQRPEIMYYMGVAAGRGIKVTASRQSVLNLEEQVYQYTEELDHAL